MIEKTRVQESLNRIEELNIDRSEWPVIVSIENQLAFLLQYDPGLNADQRRLNDIIIGVQAARELETLDMALAAMLHNLSAQVRAELESYTAVGGRV